MAAMTCSITIHVAWWLRWYIYGVALTSAITGADPDMDKVDRMIERAIRISVLPNPA